MAKQVVIDLNPLVNNAISTNINVIAVNDSIDDFINVDVPAAVSTIGTAGNDEITAITNHTITKLNEYDANAVIKLGEVQASATAASDDAISANASAISAAFYEGQSSTYVTLTSNYAATAEGHKTAAEYAEQLSEGHLADVTEKTNEVYSYIVEARQIDADVSATQDVIDKLLVILPTKAELPVTGFPGTTYVIEADESRGGATTGYRWSSSNVEYINYMNTNITGAELKALYEAEPDTNAFSDATKLFVGYGTSLDTTATALPDAINEVHSTVDIQASKLAGIESGATADQTGAEIKAAYESQADTNVLTDTMKSAVDNLPLDTVSALSDINTLLLSDDTSLDELQEIVTYIKLNRSDLDALSLDNILEGVTNKFYTVTEKSKLSNIENNATADQSDAEIKTAYENNADTNVFNDAEKGFLDSGTSLNTTATTVTTSINEVLTSLGTKQDILVNQTNIKSVNGDTLIGSGDLTISAGSGGFAANLYFSDLANTVVPAYKTLSYTPDLTATQEVIVCNNGETAGNVFLFDLPINTTLIDAGIWTNNIYAAVDSDNGDTRIRYEAFMRTPGGVETTLFTTTSPELTSSVSYVEWQDTHPVFTVDPNDIYGIRVYANTTSNSNRTVTITVGDGNASYTNTALATRHSQLRARDQDNQHPINAIEGLSNELVVRGTYTESTTEPSNPKVGDEWLDTSLEILYKRLSDGVTEAWVQLTPKGLSFTSESRVVTTVTTNTTVTNEFKRIFVDASANDIVLTMPTASNNLSEFGITRIDNSAYSVDVGGIIELLENETVDLASDNTQWRVV